MYRNSRKSRQLAFNVMVVCMLSIVILAAISLIRDWVAEDIQGRLFPAATLLVAPFVIILLIYSFREASKPR